MKIKKVSTILFVFIILSSAIGYYIYSEFNRKNKSLTALEPAFTTTPIKLIEDFSNDPKKALQQYGDKVIEVEGIVKSKESGNGITIVLGDQRSMTSLRFLIDSSQQSIASFIQDSATILLRGMCTGYNADEMGLGADILFNRAVIIKN